ncbi:hypothetical protein KXD93_22190 [Mucilaginibacter sp. BJC16-A38]|uniref:hypothetical protein n=1 Tax=Mucilaginibacter phenanthrenivorans TaxID=1234842 RepID=UPI002157234D|nr:hypothetical protein [Mucilaginibacter phenanthrenivorans]MCR8560380.1 hypothetical protein [Mucilaginibacter phenanthrenivorans]
MDKEQPNPQHRAALIRKLLHNEISMAELEEMRGWINQDDLAVIIQKIYDLNEVQVEKIAALEKAMAWIDGVKNDQRNSRFTKKIKNDFRKSNNKIILAEGDSWFNYPVVLSDVIDWIAMEENMAVYSLASGGDWLLNMLNARKYVEELSVLHPDVFLISGGGNDLVGSSRVAAMVDPGGTAIPYQKNDFAKSLMEKVAKSPIVPLNKEKFNQGVLYLSQDFFALLTFFHLQYYFLINGILTGGTNDPAKGKFPHIKIITQGYDYALPSHAWREGWNPRYWYRPLLRNLGHGSWLKTPLQIRGILDAKVQQNIVYAMIYLFNEMMIKTGDLFCQMPKVGNRVFHIDSRGSVGEKGWTDELHPLPEHFRNTGRAFVDCINGKTSIHGQVFVVNPNSVKP